MLTVPDRVSFKKKHTKKKQYSPMSQHNFQNVRLLLFEQVQVSLYARKLPRECTLCRLQKKNLFEKILHHVK